MKVDTDFGIYDCFSFKKGSGSQLLAGIVIDKDMFVMLDPLTFEKKILYKLPTLEMDISWRKYFYLDQHASLLSFSTHIINHMSFNKLEKGILATPTPEQ